MDNQPKPKTPEEAEAARQARDRRLRTSDAEVVEQYVSLMPMHVRAVMAEPLRPIFLALIHRERARCVDVLNVGVAFHGTEVRKIEGIITAAIAAGQGVNELALQRTAQIAQAMAIATAAKAVATPPGSCARCGGAKKIPSSITLPGGQVPMLPCPFCSPAPSPAASAAAPGSTDPGMG